MKSMLRTRGPPPPAPPAPATPPPAPRPPLRPLRRYRCGRRLRRPNRPRRPSSPPLPPRRPPTHRSGTRPGGTAGAPMPRGCRRGRSLLRWPQRSPPRAGRRPRGSAIAAGRAGSARRMARPTSGARSRLARRSGRSSRAPRRSRGSEGPGEPASAPHAGSSIAAGSRRRILPRRAAPGAVAASFGAARQPSNSSAATHSEHRPASLSIFGGRCG